MCHRLAVTGRGTSPPTSGLLARLGSRSGGWGPQPSVVKGWPNRVALGGAQHRVVRPGGATGSGVVFQQPDQAGRDRLFAFAVALLPEPHGRPASVNVAEVEGALAAFAGLEVKPHDQQVEVGIVAGGHTASSAITRARTSTRKSAPRKAASSSEADPGFPGPLSSQALITSTSLPVDRRGQNPTVASPCPWRASSYPASDLAAGA